jgi:hypothetical protein
VQQSKFQQDGAMVCACQQQHVMAFFLLYPPQLLQLDLLPEEISKSLHKDHKLKPKKIIIL